MSEKVNVDTDDGIDIRDHPAAHRFEVWVGDQRAGFTHYVDRATASSPSTTPRSSRSSSTVGWPGG